MHYLAYPRSRPQTVPEMVDYVIALALKYKASDIHLAINHRPSASDPYLLRYRIHGKLQMVKSDFLGTQYKEVISRFKVLAGMNITETMMPQDGQVKLETPEKAVVTLRVATVPGQDHEDLCIRVQKQSDESHSLDNVAMPADLKARLNDLIQQKSGMIVLNGPAGSGKTTTIYSIIGTLSSPERKIITAEDAIEARMPWVCHTQVSPKTNFAALCRAFMRQDADVIFIGEVRDQDSAEAAIQLAQTGHLVLTTLHTRDAIGVISRLEALNIHPNLISSTLIGSLSQRLIPRLCSDCRVPYQPEAKVLRAVSRISPPPAGTVFYKTGPGCANCVSGIAGRLPIFELFVVDPELSDLMNRGAPKQDIFNVARRKGMRTLGEDALTRAYSGYTDLSMIYNLVVGPEAESVDSIQALETARANLTLSTQAGAASRPAASQAPGKQTQFEVELHPPSVSAAVNARSVLPGQSHPAPASRLTNKPMTPDSDGCRILPAPGTQTRTATRVAPPATPPQSTGATGTIPGKRKVG